MCVFSFFCLKFQSQNKCVCVLCMNVRWLLYFALRSLESMNKNQTAVRSIVQMWGHTFYVLSLVYRLDWGEMVCTQNKVEYQDLMFILYVQLTRRTYMNMFCARAKLQEDGGWGTGTNHSKGAWLSCSNAHSTNRKFVYFLQMNSRIPLTFRRLISIPIRNQRCKCMISLN